jgi:dipeptidyl aminopeptidase/acylaminoacyl peptidase
MRDGISSLSVVLLPAAIAVALAGPAPVPGDGKGPAKDPVTASPPARCFGKPDEPGDRYDFSRAPVSLSFSPDGKTLLSAGTGGPILLWEVASGKGLESYKAPGPASLSPDGKTLALARLNPDGKVGTAHLLELSTGKERLVLDRHNDRVSNLSFSDDGRLVATGCDDGRVRVWDAATGAELRVFLRAEAEVYTLAFSPFRDVLVYVARDPLERNGILSFRDVGSGKLLFRVDPGKNATDTSIAFSADGKLMALTALDHTARVWETATGGELLRVDLEPEAVRRSDAALSPDGSLLAVAVTTQKPGTAGEAVRLWDTRTAQLVARFKADCASAVSLRFAPGGTTLASGMRDGTVLLWDIPPPAPVKSADKPPSADRLDQLGGQLLDRSAPKGFSASQALVESPDAAVALFKERLRPVAEPDPKQLARWLDDLDSREEKVQEGAFRRLAELPDLALPALATALERTTSAKARERLQPLVEAKGVVKTPQTLRAIRAIRALEQIGSPEAREVLKALAGGAADAAETTDARAALDRLAKKTKEK